MFEALGIDRTDEQIYLHLLREGPTSVPSLSASMGLSHRAIRTAVDRLNASGLTQKMQEQVLAVPLEIGTEHLIQQRQYDLELIRNTASQLGAELRSRSLDDHDDQITVLSRPVALRQFHLAAQEELRLLIREPDLMPEKMVLPSLGLRVVVEATAKAPDYGETTRLSIGVPANLALADDRSALLPLDRSALIVRPGNLLNALAALFEAIWVMATPLAPLSALDIVDEHDRTLLSLLVAGLTDDAAGARLGMSRRTVARRVQRLMQVTGAHSRLQLGWWAREREWLS
jgi:predicted transcriptional regulator